jgi:hypothetical protein
MKQASISNIQENVMGTVSFDMKFERWLKTQDFTVYPKHEGDESKEIIIQSNKRIGRLDLETGKGKLSASHPSGAYFMHYSIDSALKRLEPFEVSEDQIQALKVAVFLTGGSDVGNKMVKTDNSGACNVIGI